LCYMPCSSLPPWLDNSNYTRTWRRVQVMVLFIMKFSPTSRHFNSLNVRDQVSHPYKATGKIMFLYILIFTFLDNRRECLNGSKHYPNSVSS
jgi:hypothetical protein